MVGGGQGHVAPALGDLGGGRPLAFDIPCYWCKICPHLANLTLRPC